MLLEPVIVSHPDGECIAVFEVAEESGVKVCGLVQLTGRLHQPPKRWLSTVRATMKEFEDRARDAGCAEMRVAGRDWGRVLTDYEPLPGGRPNRLRKRLA